MNKNQKDEKISNLIIVGILIALLAVVPSLQLRAQTRVMEALKETRRDVAGLTEEVSRLRSAIEVMKSDAEDRAKAEKASTDTQVSLGVFKAFHYAPTGNRTATGTWPQAGRTIAVDPKVIPLGSEVVVDGHTYVAEDTGGNIKGKTIDIFVESVDVAKQLGVKQVEIYIKQGGDVL
jgi:3D (Asp-Asp-Asp) domain-containing protein